MRGNGREPADRNRKQSPLEMAPMSRDGPAQQVAPPVELLVAHSSRLLQRLLQDKLQKERSQQALPSRPGELRTKEEKHAAQPPRPSPLQTDRARDKPVLCSPPRLVQPRIIPLEKKDDDACAASHQGARCAERQGASCSGESCRPQPHRFGEIPVNKWWKQKKHLVVKKDAKKMPGPENKSPKGDGKGNRKSRSTPDNDDAPRRYSMAQRLLVCQVTALIHA